MAVGDGYLGGGGRGILLALVLELGGRRASLENALVDKVGRGGVGVKWVVGLGVAQLGGGQRGDEGLGTAELDGAVESGCGVELEVALKGLWQFSGTRGRGPLAWAALWGVGRLDEAVPDRGRGATEIQPAAVGVVAILASRGEHVGHEAGHVGVAGVVVAR